MTTFDSTRVDTNYDLTFSSSDLVVTQNGGYGYVRGTQSRFSGKFYFEIEFIVFGYNSGWESPGYVGLVSGEGSNYAPLSYRYLQVADSPYSVKCSDNLSTDYDDWYDYPTLTNGKVIRVAVDFDENKIWFGIDNQWGDNNTGDPVNGINPDITQTLGVYYPGIILPSNSGASWRGRFTTTDMLYTIPSGFSAWDNASINFLGNANGTITLFAEGVLKEPFNFLPTAFSSISIITSGLLQYTLDSLNDRVLHHLLTSRRWIKSPTLSFGLLTSLDPVIEVSASGYQRVDFTPSDSAFSTLDGVFTSLTDFQFPSFDGTFIGWGLFSNVYGPAPLMKKAFPSSITCLSTNTGPCFFAGQLDITFT